MRRAATRAVAVGMVVAGSVAAWGQSAVQAPAASPAQSPAASGSSAPASGAPALHPPPDQAVTGGRLHGVVKSGGIPLPGVTVTAQNTLTGKRYSTTTDITGAWSLTIPQNGRYVVRTQFAAFAAGSQEALLNATSHDQTVNFDLMLASRAAAQQARQGDESGTALDAAGAQAIRQLAGNGAQSLSLVSALAPIRRRRRERPALPVARERRCPRSRATPTLAGIRWPSAGSRGR